MLRKLSASSTFNLSHLLLLLLTQMLLTACMPKIYQPGPEISTGQLLSKYYQTPDGVNLPLRQWLPEPENTHAVLVALHGFNDYSRFFAQPGEYFRQQGIASYAYDQRGFGDSPQRGLWSGVDAYSRDLDVFVQLVKQKHPGLPVYLLGESMGGAVVIVTMTQAYKPQVAGIILAAPAIWARQTMPWYQQTLLWTLSHTMPWLTLTGEGVEITPSDNIEMLRSLGKDPLVIKETRVETIYGLVNLMDMALNNAQQLRVDTLLLYGENDEVIPPAPTYQFLRGFMQTQQQQKTLALYENGYHMLLRDLQAPVLWQDIVVWINTTDGPLPSGADSRAAEVLSAFALSDKR